MRIMREAIFMAFGILMVSTLLASVSRAAMAPRELTLGNSTSTGRTLGNVCYSVDVGDEALPCNPAFTAREVKYDFRTDLYFGNNVSYVSEVSSLLAGEGDEATVRRLFSQTRGAEMEANLEAAYRAPTFGVGVTPTRVVYFSMIRNRAMPVVSLFAAQEQTLRFHFAGYAGDEWSWGVQLRGVRRKFIAQTFSLTDVAAEDGDSIFTPETQNAFYIEPGLLREWTDAAWTPQMTLAISQFGIVDRKNEEFRTSPEFHVGGAVHPPVSLGKLMLGVDAVFHSNTKEWGDPLRLGSTYEIGMTRFGGSFGRSDHALGFLLKYGRATGGLTYQSSFIENWSGDEEWIRTVALQIGIDL